MKKEAALLLRMQFVRKGYNLTFGKIKMPLNI